MEHLIERCTAVCAGIFAKLTGIDLIMLMIWLGLICTDIIVGIAKAKLTNTPIISAKITDGLTRKVIPILLVSSFYFVTIAVQFATGLDLGIAPNIFAAAYIIAEFKSIAENAQEAGILIPEGFSEAIDKVFNTSNVKKKSKK
jgi:toxin secretion/phage lysis holin